MTQQTDIESLINRLQDFSGTIEEDGFTYNQILLEAKSRTESARKDPLSNEAPPSFTDSDIDKIKALKKSYINLLKSILEHTDFNNQQKQKIEAATQKKGAFENPHLLDIHRHPKRDGCTGFFKKAETASRQTVDKLIKKHPQFQSQAAKAGQGK